MEDTTATEVDHLADQSFVWCWLFSSQKSLLEREPIHMRVFYLPLAIEICIILLVFDVLRYLNRLPQY
jgi:hypothetical protein